METRPAWPVLGRRAAQPVVYLPGLNFTNEPPTGAALASKTAQLWFLTSRYTVHWVGRRPGAPADYTIADHARDVAAVLRQRFDRPVPVVGYSTGGFIGLQLAIDHPDVVDRLVLVGAGHRLPPAARASDARWADALEQGRTRDAWRETASDIAGLPLLARPLEPLLAMIGRAATPEDCTDGIRTARAELDFDVAADLGRIRAATLLITGSLDPNCGKDLAAATCAGIPDARSLVVPLAGHNGGFLYPGAIRRLTRFLSDRPAPPAAP